jgi:hypothetical protein
MAKSPKPPGYRGNSNDFDIHRMDRGRKVPFSTVDSVYDYPGVGDSADDDTSEED